MPDPRTLAFRAAFEALHLIGAKRWLAAPGTRGAILMLHHVRPFVPRRFAPNRLLEVTPASLDTAIMRVRQAGLEPVSLDEAVRRLASPAPERPFAAFTLDDGYRDTAEHAAPVFRRHGVPYAVYCATDFLDGTGLLWWTVLERALRALPRLEVPGLGVLDAAGPAAKASAYRAIVRHLRAGPPDALPATVGLLAQRAGLDTRTVCRELCLDWDGLAMLAADPLATIGAHTCSHPFLATLPRAEARHEMQVGRRRLEARLGRPVRHLAYPVGDAAAAGPREFALAAELGFASAVTTRPGLPTSQSGMTALPRVSLNGHFQAARHVDLLLSGAPFRLAEAARRLRARGRPPEPLAQPA